MGHFLRAAIIMTIVGIVLTAKDKRCPGGGKPLKESQGGQELFCGRGSSGLCPGDSFCVIDPADRYAVCCPPVECKKGQYYVLCKKNPCDGATCHDPDAVCEADYCGGCYTRWYKPTAPIPKKYNCGTQGEFDCSIMYLCLVNPCTYDKSCDNYAGDKVCIPNYCHGCNTTWFKTKARVPQCDSDFKGNKKD